MVTGISKTDCALISMFDYFTGREGASRESKRDYLHFLYISRGSLGETRYHIHLARRLGHLGPQDEETLAAAASSTFARLHGLIRAVEKEAGTVRKLMAAATSALCLLLAHGL